MPGVFNIGGEGQAYIGGLAGVAGVPVSRTGTRLARDPPRRSSRRWRAAPLWALRAGLALRRARQPRRHHHDHVQFHRLGGDDLPARQRPDRARPELAGDASRSPTAAWMPSLGALLGRPSPLNLDLPAGAAAGVRGLDLLWRTAAGATSCAPPAPIRAAARARRHLRRRGDRARAHARRRARGAGGRSTSSWARSTGCSSIFPAGYGFMGIAVALMGRNHPLGICLAALFFGALYQGGTELAFDMPTVTRDIVVVIEGLVILFCGALENLFRARLARWLGTRGQRHERRRQPSSLSIVAATLRLATPLVLAALGGLFTERSGIIDIGLEGKMLGSAFAAAATAAVTGSAWAGLGAGIARRRAAGAAPCLRRRHPAAAIRSSRAWRSTSWSRAWRRCWRPRGSTSTARRRRSPASARFGALALPGAAGIAGTPRRRPALRAGRQRPQRDRLLPRRSRSPSAALVALAERASASACGPSARARTRSRPRASRWRGSAIARSW